MVDASIVVPARRAKIDVHEVVLVVDKREEDGAVAFLIDVIVDGFTVGWGNLNAASIQGPKALGKASGDSELPDVLLYVIPCRKPNELAFEFPSDHADK